MATLKLNAWGQDHKITLSTDRYDNNGNLAVQMIAKQELKDLSDARHCIYQSFEIKEYQ